MNWRDKTCETCAFFVKNDAQTPDGMGSCRRNPPTILVFPDKSNLCMYPGVYVSTGACAEHDDSLPREAE